MAMILGMAGLSIATDVLLLRICLPVLHQYRGRWMAQAGGLLLACFLVCIPPVFLAIAAHRVGATQSEFRNSVTLTLLPILMFLLWMVVRLIRAERTISSSSDETKASPRGKGRPLVLLRGLCVSLVNEPFASLRERGLSCSSRLTPDPSRLAPAPEARG